jgi:hypothetical protein
LINDTMKVILDNPYKNNKKKVGNFHLIYNTEK